MANKKNNKKNNKPKKKRLFKRIDTTKLILGAFSIASLCGVTVITDMRTDCSTVQHQIEQQQGNQATEIRYVGIGGVICSIADPGSTGGWGP